MKNFSYYKFYKYITKNKNKGFGKKVSKISRNRFIKYRFSCR